MSVILEVKGLCKTYMQNNRENNVLRNVDFKVNEGEFIAIMGPSGSGKSTLLNTISGIDDFNAGEVFFNGKKLSEQSQKELSKLRLEEMGFVFQNMYMLKNLCIMDNIILPAYEAKKEKREVINKRAEKLMRQLGIAEITENAVTETSGGQLQRACICRALINNPKVIFADEPTGALNSKASEAVMEEFVKINKMNTTIIMVTHSVKMAAMCEQVIYLVDGGIEGKMVLGKYEDAHTMRTRELELNKWLMERGW